MEPLDKPMNNELTKALSSGKRILFFKSQIAAYTRRDGVTVAAHSDKRTKKLVSKDDRTGDLFAQPAPKAEKPRMPLEGHPYHDKSDEELRYIVKDAGETARIQRGMSSEGKYLDQMNDASTVLYHRKQNGIVKPHVVKPVVDMAKKETLPAEDRLKAAKKRGAPDSEIAALRREVMAGMAPEPVKPVAAPAKLASATKDQLAALESKFGEAYAAGYGAQTQGYSHQTDRFRSKKGKQDFLDGWMAAKGGDSDPKKAEPTAAKPPEGVYATLDAFEADTQPFGVVANFAAAMSGMKKDWKTHGKTLREILDAMKPAMSKDWQHQKEMSDPGFAHVYRTAFSESWRIALDIKDMDEANPKLNILDKVRGPWALDLIHRVAEGDKRFSLDNYPNDSKPYAKIKGEKVGELKKIKVTPQVLSDRKAASIISAAADSIATLRRADVGRVMDETPVHYRLSMSHYIKDKRKDLADEVDSIMAEEGFAKALPILFLKSHVKQFTRKDGTVVKEHDDKRVKKMAPTPVGRKPAQQEAPAAEAKDPEDVRGSAHGYGTHNIEEGDSIHFKAGEFSGSGKVKSHGKDGATVTDESGRDHSVHWHEVTGFKANRGDDGGKKPPEDGDKPAAEGEEEEPEKPVVLGKQEPIPAESFNAADYAKSHDQADVSPESVIAHFPDDTKDKIAAAVDRVANIEQTIEKFKKDDKWTTERQELHRKIIYDGVTIKDKNGKDKKVPGLLSPERVAAARPAKGEKPTFIILGGRGGSGKSSFEGSVYEPDRCIVLDADHIKSMLPEYEGWNAATVHEESGDLFDHIAEFARIMGLNVVLDKTMKTAKSAIADVEKFQKAGYRTEAHYMHLPRQEAGKRAIKRFLDGGEKGRFVPPEVVLSNTTNESAFDQVSKMVDAWSFSDNNVAKGSQPILISQSGEASMKKKEILQKSLNRRMLVLWRKRK